jgi:hypothetical protein
MRALGGLTAFLLLSPVSGAQDPCSRLAVATLHPGSTVGEVRAVVVGEPVESQVLLADGKRASVQEYALPDGVLHVEYDGLLTRGEAHVVLVRQPLRQTYDAVTGLVSSLGDPVAGRDSLVQGLQAGPAVWIDPQCDAVLTYYRRPEYWLTGEVLTVLRIERLSGLSGDSPASPTVEGWRASVSPSAEVAAVPSTSGEMPPERTRYVEPTYPQRAKEMGVTARPGPGERKGRGRPRRRRRARGVRLRASRRRGRGALEVHTRPGGALDRREGRVPLAQGQGVTTCIGAHAPPPAGRSTPLERGP